MSKQMKEAFKDLKGVWPDGNCKHLYVGNTINRYYCHVNKPSFRLLNYIGTREEFEACRKEKWHVWSGRGEIPTGVTRLLHSGGDFTIVFTEWKVDWFTDDIVAYTCE